VHGDPSPGNIRLTGERVTFLDWDECRVDSPDLDLAALPVDVLPAERRRAARSALAAWEAASAWAGEPEYARRRLAAVVDGAD
jgi:aminoglycoside phosphotransferase (APT) family kinase protein